MNTTPGANHSPHRVVIVGGGFGGINAAIALRRAPVAITLIDRQNYHLFQPLLYQVATGGLSPANIASPLRSILRRQQNACVRQEEVVGFDLATRQVNLARSYLSYDTLVVAAGARHSYFGHQDWEKFAPGLKTLDDATEIRARLLSAFERAEWETDLEIRRNLLTFVIVGAGPTGVELAGALAELARHTLRRDFRNIDPGHARILLVDVAPRVLTAYPEDLSQQAAQSLSRLGVTIRTGASVEEIGPEGLTIKTGGETERIVSENILWAAGVQAASLAEKLAKASGAATDRVGRIKVTPYLQLPGYDDVYVIGDMAHTAGVDDKPLPGVAPVAIQQGKYVARSIVRKLHAKPIDPFKYRDYGSLATIGRKAAVAQMGRFKFSGYFAWLLWLFIHLMQLVQFENRVLVFFQWMWSYVTRGRSARLITYSALPDNVRLEPATRPQPTVDNLPEPAK
jgi:NADH:ubiquinone reductase (H+-translocating)